jgi:hypothetical protein
MNEYSYSLASALESTKQQFTEFWEYAGTPRFARSHPEEGEPNRNQSCPRFNQYIPLAKSPL